MVRVWILKPFWSDFFFERSAAQFGLLNKQQYCPPPTIDINYKSEVGLVRKWHNKHHYQWLKKIQHEIMSFLSKMGLKNIFDRAFECFKNDGSPARVTNLKLQQTWQTLSVLRVRLLPQGYYLGFWYQLGLPYLRQLLTWLHVSDYRIFFFEHRKMNSVASKMFQRQKRLPKWCQRSVKMV